MCMPGSRVCDPRRDHFVAVEAGHCRRLVTHCQLRHHYSHWHWDSWWDSNRWERLSHLRLGASHCWRMWIRVRCCELLRWAIRHIWIGTRSWSHKSILWVPYNGRIRWREIIRRWRRYTWSLNCGHSVHNKVQNQNSWIMSQLMRKNSCNTLGSLFTADIQIVNYEFYSAIRRNKENRQKNNDEFWSDRFRLMIMTSLVKQQEWKRQICFYLLALAYGIAESYVFFFLVRFRKT